MNEMDNKLRLGFCLKIGRKHNYLEVKQHSYRHPNISDPEMLDCPMNCPTLNRVQYDEMNRSAVDLYPTFYYLSTPPQYF